MLKFIRFLKWTGIGLVLGIAGFQVYSWFLAEETSYEVSLKNGNVYMASRIDPLDIVTTEGEISVTNGLAWDKIIIDLEFKGEETAVEKTTDKLLRLTGFKYGLEVDKKLEKILHVKVQGDRVNFSGYSRRNNLNLITTQNKAMSMSLEKVDKIRKVTSKKQVL